MVPSEPPDKPAWEPPSKLQEILQSSITGRVEAFRELERDERRALDNNLAARGLSRSGMAATQLLAQLRPGFRAFADGVVDDLLGRFREVYGTIPAEAGPWIRARFEESVMAWAPRIATTIARSQLERIKAPSAVLEREFTEFNGDAFAAKRRLEHELLMLDLKAEMKKVETIASATMTSTPTADVFICHASEDKNDVAIPLARALETEGFSVWLDQAQIKVGDGLLAKIDEGLRSCRFGAVVVSPDFFRKHWTKIELGGLATLQEVRGTKVILPVWHNIDKAGVAEHSLMLASLYALSTSSGIDAVAREIAVVLRGQ